MMKFLRARLGRRGSIGAVLVALLITPQLASAQTKAATVLRAAYLKSLSFSPLFLALEKKYFEEEGLTIELDTVQSASDVVAFLGMGRLDLAFGNIGAPLINAGERDINVRVVAATSYYPADGATLSPAPVIVRKQLADAGTVKTMADLRGRKVAFNTRGGLIEYLVGGAARKVGLQVSDFDVVTLPFPSMIAALANGATDAAIMPEPLATAAREQGIGVVIDPNPLPAALATVLMFGPSLLEGAGEENGKRIMRALRRAAAELNSPGQIMSAENVKIWAKFTELPAPLIAKTAPYVFEPQLRLSASDLMRQQDFMKASGQISATLPIDRIVDQRFAIVTP
jgi:NitT/TauT family transport system substrate-binding protein